MSKDPSVVVTGFVEDLRPYISKASVFICPHISGSGIKNKVLEAMWLGKPLVVTGMVQDPINCPDLLAANDPDEFAEKVILLQNNKKLRASMV